MSENDLHVSLLSLDFERDLLDDEYKIVEEVVREALLISGSDGADVAQGTASEHALLVSRTRKQIFAQYAICKCMEAEIVSSVCIHRGCLGQD